MKKMSTEALLCQSIKELMSKKPLDDVSVQDILECSGVSRTTFYKHFYDKKDLMEAAFHKEVVEANFSDFSQSLESREIIFLNYLRDNRNFYRNALKASSGVSFRQLWIQAAFDTLLGYYRKILHPGQINEDDLVFVCRFISYGWVNMNIDWLLDESGEKPEELSRRLNRMAENGMAAFFRKG